MTRVLRMLVVLAMALVACQPSPTASRTFAVTDIPALLLQPSEAPPGTEYSADGSGSVTLDDLAQGNDDLKAGWEDLGFAGGHLALFMSGADPRTEAFVLIGNAGMVFPTPEAASQALDLHRSVGVPNLTLGSEEVPIEGIGEEAFAFTFEYGPAGVAGAICAFRVGNAMFIVAGSGPSVAADDLIAIARTIAGRALEST